MEFLVLNGTDSESSLPHCPAHSLRKRSDFLERTSCPNWSSRNANVKLHVRKKANGEMCRGHCQKVFHPMCQTLKKAAP